MKTFKSIAIFLGLFIGTFGFASAATIILTNSSDTLTVFRTNVNTSLTNLNSALSGATGNSKWATSTDNVSISPNGAMRVGIGTSSPNFLLTLGSSTAPQLSFSDNSLANLHFNFRNLGNFFFISTSSPTTNATSTNPLLTLDGASGRIGIGLGSPGYKLDLTMTGQNEGLRLTNTTDNSSYQMVTGCNSTSNNNCFIFGNSDTFNLRSDSVNRLVITDAGVTTINSGLLSNSSTTLQNATSTDFNLSSNHITFGANYLSATSSSGFRVASTTLGNEGWSYNQASSTFTAGNFPERRIVRAIQCKTSTTTPGGVMVVAKLANGNVSNYAFCDANTRQTAITSNNSFAPFEDFAIMVGKASSTPSNVWITIISNKLSD